MEFTATVSNTGNQAVTWSINPSVGTISQAGLYTAPPVVANQQTVTVTAASQLDPTKSATAALTLLTARVTGSMLTLTPQERGPNVVGTAETLLATLKDTKGSLLSGASVSFQVAGANPVTTTATTNAAGTAAFTYTGAKRGTDTVQASSGASIGNIDGRSMRSAHGPAPVHAMVPVDHFQSSAAIRLDDSTLTIRAMSNGQLKSADSSQKPSAHEEV